MKHEALEGTADTFIFYWNWKKADVELICRKWILSSSLKDVFTVLWQLHCLDADGRSERWKWPAGKGRERDKTVHDFMSFCKTSQRWLRCSLWLNSSFLVYHSLKATHVWMNEDTPTHTFTHAHTLSALWYLTCRRTALTVRSFILWFLPDRNLIFACVQLKNCFFN